MASYDYESYEPNPEILVPTSAMLRQELYERLEYPSFSLMRPATVTAAATDSSDTDVEDRDRYQTSVYNFIDSVASRNRVSDEEIASYLPSKHN
jgi:hypothetical protein